MASELNEPLISITDNGETEHKATNGNESSTDADENGKEEELSEEENVIKSPRQDINPEEDSLEDNTTEKSPLIQNVQSSDDFLSRIANFKPPKKKERSEMTAKEKVNAELQLGKLYFAQVIPNMNNFLNKSQDLEAN